jgi:hypothetical protein
MKKKTILRQKKLKGESPLHPPTYAYACCLKTAGFFQNVGTCLLYNTSHHIPNNCGLIGHCFEISHLSYAGKEKVM